MSKINTAPDFPPFQMKKSLAAYYCGMSVSSFHRAVAAGEIPPGREKTGGTFWLRTDLEQAMLKRSAKPRTDFARAI
jgi:predicted DNA-binding transcriptional regulator AlpA